MTRTTTTVLAVAVGGLLGLPTVASAASYGGGGITFAKSASAKPIVQGTAVAVHTSGSTATISIGAISPRCRDIQFQARKATVSGSGAVGFRGTLRGSGFRLQASVALKPTGPGKLAGSLRITGTLQVGKAKANCRMTQHLELRDPGAVLAALPQDVLPTEPKSIPAVYGTTDQKLARSLTGAVVVARRPDGRLQALTSGRLRCNRRTGPEAMGFVYPFALRESGGFSGRQLQSAKVAGGRFVYDIKVSGAYDSETPSATGESSLAISQPGVTCSSGSQSWIATT
ncbi:hypothetical protein PAI11_27770 [Patulibacter medicamentivorans]|uniref:Uncharacterized protein n=1 Tax=Patulibacter medicamentivorans TaxID=1097667 RepID=H0E7H5_9ACTN|nr:hypothetical protein [Patulibacter medicamentivorans]EHN10395.1 hypothetical protein PAI11_27770 [Patulibacter medicamentivorans]